MFERESRNSRKRYRDGEENYSPVPRQGEVSFRADSAHVKHIQAAYFYFTGAFVLPPIVALVLGVDLAILFFVFLLLAGAVCSMSDPGPPHNR